MPYSDNLYSANDDESDTDSFSNELSPTDGFNRSPMGPSRMVPDPSLDRKDAAEEDKVLIPRSETRNESGSTSRSATSPTLGQLFPSQNYASPQSDTRPHPASSSTSNTPVSPTPRLRADNEIFTDPRHSMRGPPPAYTPSSPIVSPPPNHNRAYSTFEQPQLEAGLPASSATEPQSMGRPSEEVDERTPLSNNEIKKPSRRRSFLRKLLFITLVFAVVVAIMSTIVKWGNDTKDADLPGGKLPDDVKEPDIGLPDSSSGPYCAYATIKTGPTLFDFSLGSKLSLLQQSHEGDTGDGIPSVKTAGEIRLRRLPKDSKYRKRGVISIETYVSDERLQVVRTWDENRRLLRISVPKNSLAATAKNCVSLEITLWLPEDAPLTELSVASDVLNIRVFDDVKFKVDGEVSFASVTGDVQFPDLGSPEVPLTSYPIDSRHITVETVSGNIKGIYPLFDSLKLASVTGDIKAGVIPQAVLRSDPASADLEVSTTSANILINLPVQVPAYTPPARDYVTRVKSTSGNIEGSYFLGSLGSLTTTTGDIKANVLPVVQNSPSTDPDDAPKSKFGTWTSSGNQVLEMLEPVFVSLLPSSFPAQPTQPMDPQDPDGPSAPNSPSSPGQHHSSPPYIPIGDHDPYQNILPPDLNEDAILGGKAATKMIKRQRATAKMWRTLIATHKTHSANIELRYPVAWEGTVTETTMSGKLAVSGDNVKVIEHTGGWPFKKLVAGKGVDKVGEGSSITMEAYSGNHRFAVGVDE